MRTWKRGSGARTAAIGLAAGLVFLLAGDRAATQAPPNAGIDPLDVLNVQVKNNVLFVIDTSGSMKWPVDANTFPLGGDDPMSRLYQAKQAVKQVVQANAGRLNFGLATYGVRPNEKNLAATQNLDGGSGISGDSLGRVDGPFMYVSQDANADVYYANYLCPVTGTTLDGFFCNIDNTFGNYDGNATVADSADIYRSFGNPQGNPTTNTVVTSNAYPAGCTPGVNCRYYLQSRLFRNGFRYTWDVTSTMEATRLLAITPIACPNPPAGLTGENPDANGDGLADQPRACIEFENGLAGPIARYYYTSAIYQIAGGQGLCEAAAVINSVAACTADNSSAIVAQMQPELPALNQTTLGLTGDPLNVLANTVVNSLGRQTPTAGLRADQATPLAEALDFVRTASPAVFPVDPTPGNLQRNFVILLTDGDDSCPNGSFSFSNLDSNAVKAAQAAESLFAGPDARHRAETLVINFASEVDASRSNKIAQAGSGGQVVGSNVNCPPGATCRNAFTAQSTTELVGALNQAIELVVSGGTFSAAQSIAGTVFELVKPPADPADPKTRFNQRVNLLYQPAFDLPNWDGHLHAFRNDGTFQPVPSNVNPNQDWDAGDALYFKVSVLGLQQGTGSGGQNRFTFAELWNTATVQNLSPARIKRRIFTSAGNGTFNTRTTPAQFDSGSAAGRNVVALWPPDPTENPSHPITGGPIVVDPTAGAGFLDDALGIGPGSVPVLTLAQLQTDLGACAASTDGGAGPLPSPCDLDVARKEGRQIILAYTAGAKVLKGTDNKPFRHTDGALLYTDRGWLLKDTTLAAPAIMTPPLKFTPAQHAAEWVLLRDGHRDSNRLGVPADLDQGFGQRNPDFDNPNPTTLSTLKPRKTVVFMGANDMLHAFSAETSEEMWGFVPFDQLAKLKEFIVKGQTRNPHIYMVASSIRVADVFLPGPYTDAVTGIGLTGRWRTVIFFGRGPGGKYYTALDVTAPGPYTRLADQTNPPWVMWNRGNPDVNLAGGPVRAADSVPYSKMGQTWSVPAIGNVKQTPANLPEWRAFVGSGYGSNANEGKTFFVLDAVTGDIVQSFGLADETSGITPPAGVGPDSALVANAAGYNSFQLDPPNTLTRRPETDHTSRVYIPDLHGRLWKFNVSSGGLLAKPGPSHPFANAVALLKLPDDANTFVFAESGNDTRVAPPAGHFKAFAWRDTAGDAFPPSVITAQLTPTPSGASGFTLDLIDDSNRDFRGTAQPGAGFNTANKGRVFFLATRFNPAGANCVSSFDSLFFGVGAETGVAVYDFSTAGNIIASANDKSVVIQGQKMSGPQVVGGEVLLSESGSLGAAPSPPPPNSLPTPPPPQPPQVIQRSLAIGSAICRGL